MTRCDPLPTVVLLHETQGGHHYDWMLADPTTWDHPDGRLWTARTPTPPDQWRNVDHWLVEPIAPHRRIYLTYEGSLTQDRGHVRRVAEGVFMPIAWTGDGIEIDLTMPPCRGRIVIKPVDDARWSASLTPKA